MKLNDCTRWRLEVRAGYCGYSDERGFLVPRALTLISTFRVNEKLLAHPHSLFKFELNIFFSFA